MSDETNKTHCQSLTTKGHRCLQDARVYHQHTDGRVLEFQWKAMAGTNEPEKMN